MTIPNTNDLTFTTMVDSSTTIAWFNANTNKLVTPKNPYIPEKIYCNSLTGTTIVKWNDGTETKVTCDPEDNFSPESGYFAALAIKVFGNDKKKFKDFWYPVISRKIVVDGKKLKPVAYGKWEKQRKETSDRRKKREGTGRVPKKLSAKSGK